MDGNSSSFYDLQGRSKNTCAGTHALRERLLSMSIPCVFMNKFDLDMLFVRHATDIEYVHRTLEVLRTDILSNSNTVNLF